MRLKHLEDSVLIDVLAVLLDEFPQFVFHYLDGFFNHDLRLGQGSPHAGFHLVDLLQFELHKPGAQEHPLRRELLLLFVKQGQHLLQV